MGCGALIASASGLGTFAPSAFADAPPLGDLAYLRLMIAAELLAVDFYAQAFRNIGGGYRPRARRIGAQESEHYTLLAALLTAAGQTPATADDIDFSYPTGAFATVHSTLSFADKLEQMLVVAYVGALVNVQTPAYRKTMAQILVQDAQHQSGLSGLQRGPLNAGSLAAPVTMAAMSDYLDKYES